MNKRSILLASSLLLLSACGGGEPQTNNNPSPNPQPTPVSNQPIENDNSPKDSIDKNIATAPTPTSGTVSGLIPSTKPQERLRKINQGKGDPFGSIRPPAVVKVASNQGLSNISRRNAIVKEGGPSGAKADQLAIAKTLSEGAQTNQGLLSEESLQLVDAEQIIISGILDLQGENVALVKTPWDETTRSVRVGDVISDSSGNINVQVKKISFSDPNTIALRDENKIILRDLNYSGGTVVLEQYGKLITREVAQQLDNEPELEEL